MNLPALFWTARLDDLKRGYLGDAQASGFHCAFCGQGFIRGHIYPSGPDLLDAETAAAAHVAQAHGSPFAALLRLDKKLTGLTELQRELLDQFHRGVSDREIAAALGQGSASTVRNHRFALREREKQARVFLAIMELLEQGRAEENVAPGSRVSPGGERLKLFPRREKKRQVLIETATAHFEPGRAYGEAEVNAILETLCEDFATLRRELIDRGVLERDPDGSEYRLRENGEGEATEVETIDLEKVERRQMVEKVDRKELKFQYKNTPRPMGVYQVKNNVNGRVLVGSSLNLDSRRNRFAFEVKNGNVSNNAELKRDWDQFGPASFTFEVLEELEPSPDPQHDYRDELAALEKKWLEKLQPYNERGYNRRPRE